MPNLANLPEWNLTDLYPAPDSPAFASDMLKARELAAAFAAKWAGTLAGLPPAELAKAISEYESLSDLIGRIGSYAQLHYVGDTTDAARAKFYGDVSNGLTELSTQLLFFELELNKIDDADLAKGMTEPALAHWKPWIDNLRMERP
ncbi:MAG: oligoendopeptidase F, partial [Phyllobacteriaceae bacterium]|nr:oligoendopeptidase F [Phyllobacteriaceae bacterium]